MIVALLLVALVVGIGGKDGGTLDTAEEDEAVSAPKTQARRATTEAFALWPGGLDAVTPAPTVTPTTPPHVPPAYVSAVEDQFFAGYRAAGGTAEAHIWRVVNCESTWRIDPPGEHLGLAQFEEGTWWKVAAITGYTDWLNPYHQGYNAATWASMIDPGSTAGWPGCW